MRKELLILVIVLMAMAVIGLFMIRFIEKTPEYAPELYSHDPKMWIEEKGNVVAINVEKATGGDGYIDVNGLQYNTGDISTVFSYDGWYQGIYFKHAYKDGDIEIMKISQKMNPKDGIIEGFIIEKFEEDRPFIFIYIDEDWKEKIKDTMVYWGKSYQNEAVFDFANQVAPGVYMQKIEDDLSRFDSSFSLHSGGVYVGNMRDDGKSTIMAFY